MLIATEQYSLSNNALNYVDSVDRVELPANYIVYIVELYINF
jgi:hypothetical protein